MAVTNSLRRQQNGGQPKFSVAIKSEAYQKLINSTLGDPDRARRFVAAISSAVAVNPSLQKCEAGTVLSAALLGESLNLSPSPQLGQYYLVPYEDRKRGISTATFQLGYKGYIQLAIRSGQYLDLDAFPVRQGEYKGRDHLTRRPVLDFIEDDEVRESRPVVGYYAYFELLNGFRKTIYWSREKMVDHADKYSPAFSKTATTGRYPKVSFQDYLDGKFPPEDAWRYSSFWYKDFDSMACKTMLRQLISKWGIMSIDLQKAMESDDAVVGADGVPTYLAPDDAPDAPPAPPAEPPAPATPPAIDQPAAGGLTVDPGTGEVVLDELPDGLFDQMTL